MEPIAEPVSTIGASAPTDPPKPIVSELATIDDQVLYLMYEKLHYVGSYTGQYPYQKAQYYNETVFADVLFTPQQNFGIIVCVIISYFHITTI